MCVNMVIFITHSTSCLCTDLSSRYIDHSLTNYLHLGCRGVDNTELFYITLYTVYTIHSVYTSQLNVYTVHTALHSVLE